jgi:hypothetical protein
MPNLTPSRRHRVLLMLLACLGLAVPLVVMQSASAANTTPVRIQIDGISSTTKAPTGTPGTSEPYVLVKAGDTFTIAVSFWDAYGNPASFNTDTTLAISTPAGTLTPSTGTALKDSPTAELTTSLSAPANQVSLTVSVAGGRGARTVTPGTSSPAQLFDVVSQLRTDQASLNTSFTQGIGGGDGMCTDATRQSPVCGIVMLPNGAASSVLLSSGVCDGTAYTPCTTKGAVIQTLFNDGGLYTSTTPATLLMKCDKSRCGTGAIKNVPVYFSLNGNDALAAVPPCPAKNTLGTGQQMCVDYVQSQRDGAGDTYLYILFTQDARVGMG